MNLLEKKIAERFNYMDKVPMRDFKHGVLNIRFKSYEIKPILSELKRNKVIDINSRYIVFKKR